MASLRDFLFGKKALDKAGGSAPPQKQAEQPAGINIRSMAEQQVNKPVGTLGEQARKNGSKKK